KMQEISNAIAEGARAFLKVEFKYLTAFVAVMAVILTGIPLVADIGFSYLMGIAFIFGAVCSAIAGILGMTVALKANVRSANAAKEGLNKAFPIAFRGGAVMGLAVVGLALLGLSAVYALTNDTGIVLGQHTRRRPQNPWSNSR
ncbi:MAG: sodium/proton-translocating pyrophosphatase, partial [Candidatus Bathyarchaeota archaeon]